MKRIFRKRELVILAVVLKYAFWIYLNYKLLTSCLENKLLLHFPCSHSKTFPESIVVTGNIASTSSSTAHCIVGSRWSTCRFCYYFVICFRSCILVWLFRFSKNIFRTWYRYRVYLKAKITNISWKIAILRRKYLMEKIPLPTFCLLFGNRDKGLSHEAIVILRLYKHILYKHKSTSHSQFRIHYLPYYLPHKSKYISLHQVFHCIC